MQGDKKNNSIKRIIITAASTLILLLLPYTQSPEKISFLVPAFAEGFALCVLFFVSIAKTKIAAKKKKAANFELSNSILDDIEITKKEIEATNDERIKKSLNKQLMSLYEERSNESTIKRSKIRGDIKKYDEEEKDQNKEAALLKEQITQRLADEIDASSKKTNE